LTELFKKYNVDVFKSQCSLSSQFFRCKNDKLRRPRTWKKCEL